MPELPGYGQPDSMVEAPDQGQAGRKEDGSIPKGMPEVPGHEQADSVAEEPDQGQAGRRGDGSIPAGVLELPVQALPDAPTANVLGKDVQARLRRSTYDFAKCVSNSPCRVPQGLAETHDKSICI